MSFKLRCHWQPTTQLVPLLLEVPILIKILRIHVYVKLSNLPTGYLEYLFEDLGVLLSDSEPLPDKLNRVLENQKILF